MLNYNLNIIGALKNIERLPFIPPQPKLVVRPDVSASFIVSAIPGYRFMNNENGLPYFTQDFFYSDISNYVRGVSGITPTGSRLPNAEISVTGTFVTSSDFIKYPLLGYSASLQIQSGSSAFLSGSLPQLNFSASTDFTFESYINFELSSSANIAQTTGSNAFLFFNYPDSQGLGFAATTIDQGKPGIRLVINPIGGQIVIDSPSIGRDANTWYHYAVERNGVDYSLLFNGKAIRTQTIFPDITGSISDKISLFNRIDPLNKTAQIRFQDHRIYRGKAKYGVTSGSFYNTPESMVCFNPPVPVD